MVKRVKVYGEEQAKEQAEKPAPKPRPTEAQGIATLYGKGK